MRAETKGQVAVKIDQHVMDELADVATGLGLPTDVLANQVLYAFALMCDQDQPTIQLPIRIKELRHKEVT